MDNLKIWNNVREVPGEAKKSISGGRLRGMTDINPMWRLKILTEQFGICGFGWKYEILDERLEASVNGEIAAFVKINLYVKMEGEWSAPIPGTGGNAFVAKEKEGLRTSDECFKMALTDAISVACKALGIGADVYWQNDKTKYTSNSNNEQQIDFITQDEAKKLLEAAKGDVEHLKKVCARYKYNASKEIKKVDYNKIIKELEEATK